MHKAVARKRRNKFKSILAAGALGIGMFIAVPTAAQAADYTCAPGAWLSNCGQVRNLGNPSNGYGLPFKVSRNYSSPTNASGPYATIARGGTTESIKTSAGNYYDWDAVLVPAGHCAGIHGGPGYTSYKYVNRSGKSAVWEKIDNWGAQVVVTKC